MNLKKILFFLPIVVIILIVTGCARKEIIKKEVGELDNAPSWVKTKQLQNKISELGMSTNQKLDFRGQRNSAIEKAQIALSKKIKIKVTNIFNKLSDVSVDETEYEENVETATKKIVIESIQNSKIIKLWRSDLKNIYVLVSTDTQKIKDSFRNSISTVFKEMPSISSNYALSLEQGQIDIELSK